MRKKKKKKKNKHEEWRWSHVPWEEQCRGLMARVGLAMFYGTLSMFFERVDDGLPWPTQTKSIFPVKVVRL